MLHHIFRGVAIVSLGSETGVDDSAQMTEADGRERAPVVMAVDGALLRTAWA